MPFNSRNEDSRERQVSEYEEAPGFRLGPRRIRNVLESVASNICQALLNGKSITVLVDLQPKDPFLILCIMSNVKHGELRYTMHCMER